MADLGSAIDAFPLGVLVPCSKISHTVGFFALRIASYSLTPRRYWLELNCGSRSTTKTFLSQSRYAAKCQARLTVRVDFPTPPFMLIRETFVAILDHSLIC